MGVIIRNGIEYSGSGGGNIEYLTQAQYDALPESKLTDDIEYRITDAGSMGAAENVGYDNSKSSLEAVNVQDAIDKLDDSLSDYSKDIIIARVLTNTITIAQQNFSREYVSYTPPSGYTVLKAIPAYCSQWCGYVTGCNYETNNKRIDMVCANFHISSPINAVFGCDVILKKN